MSDFDSRLQQLDRQGADSTDLSLDLDTGVGAGVMAGSMDEELASLDDGLAFAVLALEEDRLPDAATAEAGAEVSVPGFELLSDWPDTHTSPRADTSPDTGFLTDIPEPALDVPQTGSPEPDAGAPHQEQDWLSPVNTDVPERLDPPLPEWSVQGAMEADTALPASAADEHVEAPLADWLVPETPDVPVAAPAASAAVDTVPAELLEAETPGPEQLRANLGEEIYDIFVEEITEISTSLQEWVPQWQRQQDNRALLTDIRRAWHTCKGSGRMAGALALGDYAWAHENLLNRVLEGGIPVNDGVTGLLNRAVSYLQRRLDYFLVAEAADAGVQQQVARVEAFMAAPDQPLAAEAGRTGKVVPPVPESSGPAPQSVTTDVDVTRLPTAGDARV
nr:Hpt domain-containing protein [Thiolinea sp.]